MIQKEAIEAFYRPADQIVEYFERKLQLKWPPSYKKAFVMASALRNCIVHNLAVADARLARVSRYKVGDHIRLDAYQVNELGLKARDLARTLYAQASRLHLDGRNGS